MQLQLNIGNERLLVIVAPIRYNHTLFPITWNNHKCMWVHAHCTHWYIHVRLHAHAHKQVPLAHTNTRTSFTRTRNSIHPHAKCTLFSLVTMFCCPCTCARAHTTCTARARAHTHKQHLGSHACLRMCMHIVLMGRGACIHHNRTGASSVGIFSNHWCCTTQHLQNTSHTDNRE